VEFVDSRVNPKTGTIHVDATVPNPERMLLPDIFVTDSGAESKVTQISRGH
jgi:multidrug efflux pump subunit AcrA (membrane-fusion protein)